MALLGHGMAHLHSYPPTALWHILDVMSWHSPSWKNPGNYRYWPIPIFCIQTPCLPHLLSWTLVSLSYISPALHGHQINRLCGESCHSSGPSLARRLQPSPSCLHPVCKFFHCVLHIVSQEEIRPLISALNSNVAFVVVVYLMMLSQ
jgi:hypothetical protein